MRVRVLLCSSVVGLGLASGAPAADLMQVYQKALTADPRIREADANRLAARESRPQAWAALLPQIDGLGQYTKDKSNGTANILLDSGASDPRAQTGDTTDKYWQVQLRQTVFQWDQWIGLKRASSEVAQAEADYKSAQQNLVLRVSQRYFDVLAAQDNLTAQESANDAITRQLEQAEKRFEVGLIAITDVQEAKAAHDTGTADVIAAKRALASSIELLREFTGEQYDALARPGEDMPLKAPDPAEEDRWVETSMQQNLALISSHLASDISRDNIKAAFGGHLPSVTLALTKSNNQVTGSTTQTANGVTVPSTVDTNGNDKQLVLQVSVPILSSGATQSRVRQAEYRYRAANQRYVRTSRETERAARDAYLGVLSEISRVKALKQALESSTTALQATEAGYEVGTRTAVDVLQARRTLVQAETNYSRSRYDYLLNVISLKLAAGNLNDKDLAEINSWLKPPAAPASGAMPTQQ